MLRDFSSVKEKITTMRRQSKLATFVVLVVLCMVVLPQFLSAPAPVVIDAIRSENAMVLPASEPIRLTIDTLGIATDFEAPLGLLPTNEIEVPVGFETVGYYKFGPTPGELGPSVILGHVDSYEGPAVFYKLGQLREGDEISVERADGTVAVFSVTRLERHAQSGFPTEEVYSDIDHAGLRLITCSGTYDKSVLRYTHNLIVFAELVATSTATSTE